MASSQATQTLQTEVRSCRKLCMTEELESNLTQEIGCLWPIKVFIGQGITGKDEPVFFFFLKLVDLLSLAQNVSSWSQPDWNFTTMVFTRKPCVFVDIHREPQWNVNRWASLRKEENLIQNTTDIVNYSENLKSSLGTEEWLSTESSPTAIKHWAPCTQHGSNFYGDFLWATDQF